MTPRTPDIDELLRRAQAEIDAERPWRARAKLRTWLAQFPFEPRFAELLAELELAVGELPEAGRWLWLLGSTAEQHQVAIRRFLEHADTETLWNSIPRGLRSDPAWLAPAAVESACIEAGLDLAARRERLSRRAASELDSHTWTNWLVPLVGMFIVVLGLWKAVELVF